jgi:hypothetical protein
MGLFFITFYAANSLMRLEYWKNKLTIEQASEVYSEIIKEYDGFEMPGEYGLLYHILPDSIIYVPSYLLTAVRHLNWICICKINLVICGGKIKTQV